MQCERSRELLGAYHDQELDPELRREIAAHLQSCGDCTATLDEISCMSGQLAAMGREQLPSYLRSRVVAALAEADGPPLSRLSRLLEFRLSSLARQAAVLVIACALTALATAIVLLRAERITLLEREIVTAHVRSLLQDSPIQVASSDSHTVKPWFGGRIDFSPPVKDLTSEGFQLVGGRVDYIGERRVAALVYRRRLHVVNVFLWPSANVGDVAPLHEAVKGFNLLVWNNGGIAYWSVSDLNEEELRQLQSLLG